MPQIETPIGTLSYAVSPQDELLELWLRPQDLPGERSEAVETQLSEFFQRERRKFDLKLAPKGTPFQQAVWQELLRIPYGETRSYADLARALGQPTATRAVGAANGANPIALIIPCHRVIGSSGSLTGYAGGLDMKAKLLAFEGGTGSLFD